MFDDRRDGDHNGMGLVETSNISEIQDNFFSLRQYHSTEFGVEYKLGHQNLTPL